MRALTALLVVLPVAARAETRFNPISAQKILAPHAVRAPLHELVPVESARVGAGTVVRFKQIHNGLPVMGGELVVRLDAQGRVRRLSGKSYNLSYDKKPRLVAPAAIEAARRAGARGLAHANSAAVAIDPHGPRLVWAVRLVPEPLLLENAIYYIDDATGALVRRIDLLRYAKASVFSPNPSGGETPAPKDIPSPFAPTQPDGYLESALLKAYNCIDKGEIRDIDTGGFGSFKAHICTPTPTAKASDGDYSAYPPSKEPWSGGMNGCPNAPYGTMMSQPLDEFAEQHLYWHVANTYAFFRSLFAENGTQDWKLRAQPLALAVNVCTPDFTSGGFDPSSLQGPLVPFDNAFFSPGAGNPISELLIGGQDAIMFGQGSQHDFSYDGDVIAHEFTHGVIDTLRKLQIPGDEDVWGLHGDPGAMNEGLADYFAAALYDNGVVGEYAGANIPADQASNTEGAVRDLNNTDKCGDDRWGEAHQDSQAFSAALWGARVKLSSDEDKRKLDRAVLAAIQGFSNVETMTSAAQAIADETEELLGKVGRAAVEESLAAHKIFPACDRVIDYVAGTKKKLLALEGTDSPFAHPGATRVPGLVQWKIEVPAGNDTITANLRLSSQGGTFSSQGGGLFGGGGGAPKLELALAPEGTPIQWVVGTNAGNEVATAPFSGTRGSVTATLSALSPGVHHVMIYNSGGGVIAEEIGFTTSCNDVGGCVPALPDMATAMPTSTSRGCSCEVGGRGSIALVPSLLLLFLVVALRRRRA